MSLTHAAFAVAGLLAATGPVIIHLLNRRRYRTVEWGAMAFLRKAVQRSHRAMRLRDLLLLVLRTAAVLLFGFALARPVLTRGGLAGPQLALLAAAVAVAFAGAIGFAVTNGRGKRLAWGLLSISGVAGLGVLLAGPDRAWSAGQVESTSSRAPVHAIFVLDNSRSMAARTLGGTLLDAAKQRAVAALDGLPTGSRVSVLPLCGPERSYTLDAHAHADDARVAIERVTVTDRSGSALAALALAAEAAKRVPDLPGKRVVFIGDQQATGWPREGLAEAAEAVGGAIQVVSVALAGVGNVSVDSFAVQDGLAESNLPATFLATVRCTGDAPASGVEVTLYVSGNAVASQTVDLRPGQTRDVLLTAPLDVTAEPGKPTFVPATLSVRVPDAAANRLDRDDSRAVAVPLVTALPVVFVDQYGGDEDLDAGRVGETYRLRRLLAPRPADGVYDPLVAVRHVGINGLNESTLEDARLVVVAGVERPTDAAVRLLRQYVEQGGPLVLAAGGSFDPAAWTAAAWLDGRGVLPAPLAETPVGVRPSQATGAARIEPFRLDTASLDHPFFRIEGEPAEALAGLWGQPFFFQTVAADVSDAVVKSAVAAESARIAAERSTLAMSKTPPLDLAPSWLLWKTESRAAGGDNPDAAGPNALSPDLLAARTAPRVLARFAKAGASGNLPYVVERRLGYGRVVLLAGGISSDWDTLTQTNAIVLLDRVTRSLLEETLPRRSFEAGSAVALPVERRPDVTYALSPPEGKPRPVAVDATGNGYVVRLEDASTAGIYTVAAQRASGASVEPIETTVLAVTGSPSESDLMPITPDRLAEIAGEADLQWVGPGEVIAFTGGPVRGSGLWKWLAGAVLACLIGEMAVASRSRVVREAAR